MTYLYHGGSHSLKVEAGDVLELMAAANFFQLPGLLRYCEYRCSHLVRSFYVSYTYIILLYYLIIFIVSYILYLFGGAKPTTSKFFTITTAFY
jgi:ankyrin repeat/BTB/POZ domain-containing protein 2